VDQEQHVAQTHRAVAIVLGELIRIELRERAREADALSAFGGVVALNRQVDVETARVLVETFLEAGVAPLDLVAMPPLTFRTPDRARFPCLGLAYEALRQGGVVGSA
jgi:hypothetical protein